MRRVQLCNSLSILWHCLSLELEWKLTFSSPVTTAEFSKFANILSAYSRGSFHSLTSCRTHLERRYSTAFTTTSPKILEKVFLRKGWKCTWKTIKSVWHFISSQHTIYHCFTDVTSSLLDFLVWLYLKEHWLSALILLVKRKRYSINFFPSA